MTPNDIKGKLFVGLTFLGIFAILVAGSYSPEVAYPACDNEAARTELGKLYDNKRLLHAVEVSDLRPSSETISARHCLVTVKWGDGSVSDVKYEFDRPGHGRGSDGRTVTMWIGYNDGMIGPAFRD